MVLFELHTCACQPQHSDNARRGAGWPPEGRTRPPWKACSPRLLLTAARARGREVFILEDLKDANIVQFLGACFEEGSTMLVTGA